MTDRLTAVSLASASPRRLSLLQSLDLKVVVVRSAYDERNDEGHADAPALALRHACGKADAAEATGPSVLIAADTIVDVDGSMLGKPSDEAQAKSMLRTLSNRWHIVHTGFVVVDRASGRRSSGVESTAVRFADLDDATIEGYVASGEPMDKAGAYGIQGRGALLVERIDGDFYTVMGLPLTRVAAALRDVGQEIR
jgi:nucleoside triphosphate pyrophosphatase